MITYEKTDENHGKDNNLNMDTRMIRDVKAIRDRPRTYFDASKVSTRSNTVRFKCVELTMKLFRALSDVADPVTYEQISQGRRPRSSASASTRENRILPEFASGLARSPGSCSGATPVQVMSQAMANCPVELDLKFMSSRPNIDESTFPTTVEYCAMFAEMLRISICSVRGISFLNARPVNTTCTTTQCTATSFFSEWLRSVVEVHDENEYKVTILCTGEPSKRSSRTRRSRARP
ncbi:hypothetical protein MAPG_10696 [Magnaporthiopsis poae ATCC 64411]|uniref:Uncharacterized protein n=1 Tax=Magnaporthiopsis poae (strain ATCC 64411 / 73-15) TaxID=644358 RepID=A0A0C4EDA2_MAGP6|nr:hypothetical protein MAPG_10696 [Magnaporthiopsis poae ATCC 64411]